nr:SH3 domain-containing protein 2-like [Ipomoea batatas]
MEALKRQASWLKEQVTRQQHAVLKQFGAGGYGGSNHIVTDEAELLQYQKLERLYLSTRTAKHLQRDIVRGVEGYVFTGSKQVEIGTKLSEDSKKYGSENTCTTSSTLSRAALSFSRARAQLENERGVLLKSLGTQAVEVSKRQAKLREGMGNPDVAMKLEAAEAKLQDLKSNMTILGKEAISAMAAVEAQQQRLTLQRLITMAESERAYHHRVLQILQHLEGEMRLERERIEAPSSVDSVPPPPSYEEANGVFTSPMQNGSTDSMGYFLGEAMHSYHAESDVELNLSVGDCIVIRKVSNNGWAEGECKGKAGWFPFSYIERRERVLASKVIEVL